MKKSNISPASITVKVLTNVSDFSAYKSLKESNRDTNETHIKKLMESFVQYGTGGVVVTIVKTSAFSGKNELYTADGQHTIIALERLGMSATVIIVRLVEDTPLKVTQYISTLNNNAKAWSTNNFLSAFASNGITEYKKMSNFKAEHGFTITDLLYIFLGNGGAKENKLFKSGTMKFIDEKDSTKLMNAVVKVMNVIPNKAYCRRSLYKVMRVAKDYNKMAKAILKASTAMEITCQTFSSDETEFYNHLVRIYQQEFNVKVKSAKALA